VEVDGTTMPIRMLGLASFVVLDAVEFGGELELLVETTESVTGCPSCGVIATAHGRRDHLVRDIRSAGRPVLLLWRQTERCQRPRLGVPRQGDHGHRLRTADRGCRPASPAGRTPSVAPAPRLALATRLAATWQRFLEHIGATATKSCAIYACPELRRGTGLRLCLRGRPGGGDLHSTGPDQN
jgi:hypothetical protein